MTSNENNILEQNTGHHENLKPINNLSIRWRHFSSHSKENGASLAFSSSHVHQAIIWQYRKRTLVSKRSTKIMPSHPPSENIYWSINSKKIFCYIIYYNVLVQKRIKKHKHELSRILDCNANVVSVPVNVVLDLIWIWETGL